MRLQRFAIAILAFSSFVPTSFGQTWQPVAAFPTSASPRNFATALVDDHVVWILGGTPLTSGGDASAHEFFTTNGTIATLPIPLEGGAIHGGVARDALGRILVFGGADAGGGEGDSYVWTSADGNNGSFPSRSGQAPKTYFAVVNDDQNRVYSIGGGPGSTATSGNMNKGRVERYDATTNVWQVLAPLPTPVADAAACYDGDGHVVVVGGYGATGSRTANVARYDIASNTWSDTSIADFPTPVSGARAARGVDGRVYVIGGNNGVALRTTWILDAGATTWRAGPDLAVPHEGAAVGLCGDDYLYVFGGGTGSNEKLFTPRCPEIVVQPASTTMVLGQPIGFAISVSGAAPFTYRWRHDGVELYDGVQFGGSAVTGATSPSLGLTNTSNADAGAYECVVTNACGSTTTVAAQVSFVDAVALPTVFVSRSIHPSGAQGSAAMAIDGGRVGGRGLYPAPPWNSQYHPLLWDEQRVATDVTPPNSIGGVINAMRGGAVVGWWWWPYYTPAGTGYNQHACAFGAGATVTDLQPQGWEVGEISDTDGVHHVGWALYDSDHSIAVDGVYWASSAPFSYTMLTTGGDYGTSGANVGAVEGDRLFGVTFGSSPYGATMWARDASNTWQSLSVHPPMSQQSFIQGADSGEQVGRARFGLDTHSGLWGGSSGAFVDLHPVGSNYSEALATRKGIQVGFASFAGSGAHAYVWRGTAASGVDLHAFSPVGFAYETANDLEVDVFGTVTIVGMGTNTAITPNRTEALEWRANANALSTDAYVVSATNGCTLRYTLYGGPQHAGRAWRMYPTVGRTRPVAGTGLHLPPQSGFFDAIGFASAQIVVPAGSVLSPQRVAARYRVVDATGATVLASNVVTIELLP